MRAARLGGCCVLMLVLGVGAASAGGWLELGPPLLLGPPGGRKLVGLTQPERAAFDAAADGNAEGVKEFLRHHGNPSVRNEANESLLEVAAYAGSWTVVDAILLYPAPVTDDQVRAAHAAAAKGAANGRDTARAAERLKLWLGADEGK